MLRYLQAHLELDAVPLPERADAAAMRTAFGEVRRPRAGGRRGGTRICLGWNHRSVPGEVGAVAERARGQAAEPTEEQADEVVHHAGATRGFTTFVGFSPRTQVGLAVMAGTPPLRSRGFVQSAYDTLRSPVADRREATEA
ncbi:hypothetical protein [Kitasatospora sp. NBC_00085]|uniref:hypothetical protein n=1 Tax=Kitasatospora sp. NBC_00085 TaxID=2903566 RepID=UPI00386591EB